MKAKELRDKSIDELKAILEDTHKSTFKLINDMKIEKRVYDKSKLNQNKKIVARILTIIRERELAAAGA